MQYRKLGESDFEISRIGFGAWAAGGGGWAFALGAQDDDETIEAINRALDLGVNWIDTAPLYGLGHSEEVVQRAIRGRSERPYVFTKCGMPWDESGRIVHSLRRDSIRRECEDSLRRLRTDVIDIYQLHWNKPAEEIEEGLEAVAELQREGKIRHIGVSNFNVDEIKMAERLAPPVSLQPPYSLLDRAVEDSILPYCRERGIGVIVYSPMKSGLLSGKMTRERIAAFPADDLRRTKPEFQEPELSRGLAIAERLEEIGKDYECSAASVAVAWTLRNETVTGAIVGMRTAAHVDGIVGAVDLQIPFDEIDIEPTTNQSESV